MTDRKKKQRALAKAGIIHAAGWINAKDGPAFVRMVAKAAADVKRVDAANGEGE